MSGAAHAFVQFSLPGVRGGGAPARVELLPARDAESPRRQDAAPFAHLGISSATELQRLLERERRGAMPTTIPAVDRLLGGGLERGKLVELFARRSTGRFAIVLSTLAATTSCGENAVLIDHGDHLDPSAAEAAGVDLARLLWVRPKTFKDALAATEMVIATGFPLVVLDLGIRIRRGPKRVDDSVWIRLARAAAAHGTALLVSAPFHISGTSGEAVLASRRARAQWSGGGKAPSLLTGITSELALERHRHVRVGGREEVKMKTREAIRRTENDRPQTEDKTREAIRRTENDRPQTEDKTREAIRRTENDRPQTTDQRPQTKEMLRSVV